MLAAAAEVLEDAGFRVMITKRDVCCGRPTYDYGMLDRARRMLRQALDEVRPFLREGVPVVGVEPSCIAVFRDELGNLFPDDPDARLLKRQSFMLDEFLGGACEVDVVVAAAGEVELKEVRLGRVVPANEDFHGTEPLGKE